MKQKNASQEAPEKLQKPDFSMRKFWQEVGGSKWIVPYANGDSFKILKHPGTWVIFIFAFGVLPLNQSVPSNENLLVFVMGYFALAWAAYFYVFIAKCRTNLWLGLATALFTVVIGVPFGRLLRHTVLLPFYNMNSSSVDIVRLVGTLGSHGLAEELLKAVPLVLLAFALKQIKRPIDGVFYGALSGLGFSAWEGYKYILSPDAGGILMDVLVRSTALPFLHAAYTGISGYFVALAARGRRPVPLCALGIGIAATIHGCYDFLTNTPRLLMAVIVYLLFTAYADRSHQLTGELEKVETTPAPQRESVEASQAATG